jgi:Peptidase A4 family
MKRMKFATILCAAASCVGVNGSAAAQSRDVLALYESAATISTNIEGVRTFPAPPSSFEPLTASDQELAAYGFPPRPDQKADPDGYRVWARAMSIPQKRWYGELKPRKARSGPGIPAPFASPKAAADATSFTASTANSINWSGVVNTLPLTKYNAKSSFSIMSAQFQIPWPQEAFGFCDNDTDHAAFWIGFDGWKQNDVLQSGVDTYSGCDGSGQGADAWIEWYPAPPITVFDVAPGDDMYVVVSNSSATVGTIFIEDETHQQSGSFALIAPVVNGKQVTLHGNQAEYIVERPGGDGNTPNGLYPLANYIWSFWDFAHATTFSGVKYYPGSTNTGTIQLSMTDDSGAVISVPHLNTGLQNMFVQDHGCAFKGGCTP